MHDPLFVRNCALQNEGRGLAIAVCDMIRIACESLDQVKALIMESTGLAQEQVLSGCTHTHTEAEIEQAIAEAGEVPPEIPTDE